MNWREFAAAAPEFGVAGLRLFVQPNGVAIGFLATIGDGLHLAPVCPIFCGESMYLSVGRSTPKRRDLDRDGRYVLHAWLGENDEEFRIEGRAAIVAAETERGAVHAAIRFGAFDPSDPIYELDIRRAMWGHWENVGRPGTRAVRRFFDVERGA